MSGLVSSFVPVGTLLAIVAQTTDEDHEEERDTPADQMVPLLQLSCGRITLHDLKIRQKHVYTVVRGGFFVCPEKAINRIELQKCRVNMS